MGLRVVGYLPYPCPCDPSKQHLGPVIVSGFVGEVTVSPTLVQPGEPLVYCQACGGVNG